MATAQRRGRGSVSNAFSGTRYVLFLLVFVLIAAPAQASRLVSASVGTREKNASLLVLKFDVPTQLSVQNREGRTITLGGEPVQSGPETFRPSGLVRGLSIQNGNVVITASRYVSARLTSAGAGIYLMVLHPAKEKPQSQRETASTSQAAAAPVKTQPLSNERQATQTPPQSEPEQPLVDTEMPDKETEPPLQESPQATAPNSSQVPIFDMDKPLSQDQKNLPKLADLYEWVPVQPIVLPTTVQFALELSQQGNRNRAILLLESIRPDEPEYGWSRIALGRMMEQSGDYNKALDYYRQALEDRETEGIAAVRIALAFQAVGNPEAAVALWERVLDMNQGQIFVDPSEMPLPRTRPMSYAMQDQMPLQPIEAQPPQMEKSDTTAPDSNGTELASGKPRNLKKKLGNHFAFLRFWPYAVGLILLVVLLWYGLKWLRERAKAEHDLFHDVESLGLDLDAEADETAAPPAAGARVANMYAEQSADDGGADIELKIDDDVATDDEISNDVHLDDEEFNLSDDKVAQVREMHSQGSTVREIAEELGLGQDEVRMAIRLAEAGQ